MIADPWAGSRHGWENATDTAEAVRTKAASFSAERALQSSQIGFLRVSSSGIGG